MQYFRRDSLYQLRELGELHRLLFCFFRGLAARIKELNLTWAATFQSQLDSIAKQYDTGSLVDMSILPTFPYFMMKKMNLDCSRGALAWKALLQRGTTGVTFLLLLKVTFLQLWVYITEK